MARNALDYYVVTWNCPSWEREVCKSFATKRAAFAWAARLGVSYRVEVGHNSAGFHAVEGPARAGNTHAAL